MDKMHGGWRTGVPPEKGFSERTEPSRLTSQVHRQTVEREAIPESYQPGHICRIADFSVLLSLFWTLGKTAVRSPAGLFPVVISGRPGPRNLGSTYFANESADHGWAHCNPDHLFHVSWILWDQDDWQQRQTGNIEPVVTDKMRRRHLPRPSI